MTRKALFIILLAAIFALASVCGSVDKNLAQTPVKGNIDAWEEDSLDEIHTVRGIIYDWLDTWQRKDINGYMSFYSPEFSSGKLDYNGWKIKKTRLFKRPGRISLQISKLLIFIEGNRARASFIQQYEDAYIADVGEKNIKLIKSDNSWKIVSEQWKAIDQPTPP